MVVMNVDESSRNNIPPWSFLSQLIRSVICIVSQWNGNYFTGHIQQRQFTNVFVIERGKTIESDATVQISQKHVAKKQSPVFPSL